MWTPTASAASSNWNTAFTGARAFPAAAASIRFGASFWQDEGRITARNVSDEIRILWFSGVFSENSFQNRENLYGFVCASC
jgi:hypothetical protein